MGTAEVLVGLLVILAVTRVVLRLSFSHHLGVLALGLALGVVVVALEQVRHPQWSKIHFAA
ncbi:hypothetical protein ACMD2_06114 [Ananas comosus]|uniref:Uncharacterized protein n=1 Tax=Ananas comosus TaxID=4615 RepID=A0A199VQP2_ANACO|nr:hypothetical protein ACMD2_06114 [Ananas comosus]